MAAGAAVAVSYSTLEQFAIPLRGSREFGLERSGIARLLMLAQAVDVVTLLPLGALADRRGTPRVLGSVLLVFALALALIGFGTLPLVAIGCALFGFSMAGWMLPIGILRSVTPPAQVAWRTALYRVSVDGGMFAGPFVSGLLGARHVGVLPGLMVVVMAAVGVALLVHAAAAPRRRLGDAAAVIHRHGWHSPCSCRMVGGMGCADVGSGSSACWWSCSRSPTRSRS